MPLKLKQVGCLNRAPSELSNITQYLSIVLGQNIAIYLLIKAPIVSTCKPMYLAFSELKSIR